VINSLFLRKVLTVLIVVMGAVFGSMQLTACSSKGKSGSGSGTGSSDGPILKGEGNANRATTSESELLERYSLTELSSVQNALRVIFEKSTDPKADTTETVLECQITGDQAKHMMGNLRGLIESQTDRERDSYTMDPGVYARSNGLETCGSKCACGALAAVLKPVSAKSFKAPAQRVAHDRSVKRLQAKASRQTAEESLTCARKVSWFCSSDLRGFLEK
jgi:hypothetical protein